MGNPTDKNTTNKNTIKTYQIKNRLIPAKKNIIKNTKQKFKIMESIKKGDYFYLINESGTYLRKVINAKGNFFSWNDGFTSIWNVKKNPNEKSRVKFVLYR